MKGDLCGKILSRGIEQQNAVGLEKISVDRDAAPLIHPLPLILSPCPYAIGRRISSRTGYPSCGQVHYVLDFLGLDGAFSERDLEAALVSHIERFLLALGHGFCFVGRQQRLPIGDKDYYVDLVF